MTRAMVDARLAHPTDLTGWREAARRLLANGIPPGAVRWLTPGDPPQLFETPLPPLPAEVPPPAVPRAFVDLADQVIRHGAPERFGLLYRLLWRQVRGERALLSTASDPDVARAMTLSRQVCREAHHMQGFVRFHETTDEAGDLYLSWFEPEHHVLDLVAPYFAARMAALHWSILTPLMTAHWDGSALHYGPGSAKPTGLGEDAVAECWKTYYASTFNPARVNVAVMTQHMPRRYWRAMEETALVPGMVRTAAARAEAMVAATPLPPSAKGRVRVDRRTGMDKDAPAGLDDLRAMLPECRRCDLWRHATQAVPGTGQAGAEIMLVGEQPGDQEDLAGQPFVGPAGAVLDRALAEAGLDRTRLYVTNAVKHFKYQPHGKRRLHQKPDAGEVIACRFWLDHELQLVRPRLVVGLGATAAQAMLGHAVAVTKVRGQVLMAGEWPVLVTVHPSAVLRQPDAAAKEGLYRALVQDLSQAAARAANFARF